MLPPAKVKERKDHEDMKATKFSNSPKEFYVKHPRKVMPSWQL
jgi:hypothetical protein